MILLNTTTKGFASLAATLALVSYIATGVVSATSAIDYLQVRVCGGGEAGLSNSSSNGRRRLSYTSNPTHPPTHSSTALPPNSASPPSPTPSPPPSGSSSFSRSSSRSG